LRYGITIFATDETVDVVELCRAADERGVGSFWLPEHTHIPVSRRTPPPTGHAELPPEYRRTLDPLVSLAACASATERIRLGTGILLAAQREPIVTAKAVATLDLLSSGRVDLGIGFGWNEDEIEHHGVPFAARRHVAREHVGAMRALWTDEQASFHGDHVDFSPSWSYPKPVQPRLPVLLGGGTGPKLLADAAAYADGWIPVGGAGLAEAIPRYRAALEAAGRDPGSARIVPFGSEPTAGKLDHFASIGVTEVVCRIPSVGRSDAMRALDAIVETWETWSGERR
jgi:probable F420-dependent oxidoreductase